LNNLIIDIGNTNKKVAVENNGKIVFLECYDTFSVDELNVLEQKHTFDYVILSSVSLKDETMKSYLRSKYQCLVLSDKTPIPIVNHYQSPDTLGTDRLAGVVAANNLYADTNCLVIQLGTCITCDFINKKGEYIGGSISPGLQMRLKALNHFTDKLPLINKLSFNDFIGKTTDESIQSGVFNGILHECNGSINQYKNTYPDIKIIVTGGDMLYFNHRFQHEIISIPHLVIVGLSIILKHNVAFQKN